MGESVWAGALLIVSIAYWIYKGIRLIYDIIQCGILDCRCERYKEINLEDYMYQLMKRYKSSIRLNKKGNTLGPKIPRLYIQLIMKRLGASRMASIYFSEYISMLSSVNDSTKLKTIVHCIAEDNLDKIWKLVYERNAGQ